MLVSPLANPVGWTWNHFDVTDLPATLRGQFPPTVAGAAAAMSPPSVNPPGVAGTGPATTLRFPWTGRAQHSVAGGGVQWIWGSNGDVPRFPELRLALPFGNPLIALRYTASAVPLPNAFPDESARRQAPLVLTGPTDASVTDLAIVATYPLRPGMDTLSVLRHLRDAFHTAFPDGHADRALATSWAAFIDALDTLPQRLRLLEPSGAPVQAHAVTLNRAAGPLTFDVSAEHRGDLVLASGLDRAAFDASVSLDVAGGSDVVAATPAAQFPSGLVNLTPGDSHIDLAILDQWLAPNGASALPRFTRGNRVTPFIHGPAYYADLFTELNAIVAPGAVTANGLFYLAGPSLVHNRPLVPAALGLTHRTVADLAAAMAGGGAEARFLAMQLVQLQPGVLETAVLTAELVGVFLSLASLAMAGASEDGWDRANFVIHSQIVAWGLILGGAWGLTEIVTMLESNKGAIDALAAIASVEAHLDPYSAGQSDNPLSHAPGTNILIDAVQDIQERFNIFHQKIAIVRNDAGMHAYCGGMDLNSNRLDDRDHGIRRPYHDVHARLDGPAVADLATTFVERWQTSGRSALTLGAPGAMPTISSAGTDVVQVARTYFGPAAGGTGLSFSATGERTIMDTEKMAIRNARRYIYLEDQYLTPPPELVDELTAAASRVSGPLIIVVPELPDQPFGFVPRMAFVSAMRTAWGDRFKVGTMRMRFSRAETTVSSATGRLWLTRDVAEADDSIVLGPSDRLPNFPFWLVVGNEVMRATRKVSASASPATTATDSEIAVQRAGETQLFGSTLGTERMRHKAKVPVTCGSFPGVYVQAKTMLIDDAFASIGSANVNRRGYYSDGECSVFALPESLTHGDNWIREFRTRLWAEALGTTEDYARVAFANPCAHLELWERRFTTGSRFTPYQAQPLHNELELRTALTNGSSALDVLRFSASILAGVADVIVGVNATTVFDTVVDPSSRVAPP